MNAPYPWQRDSWNRLIERERAGTLPHALLISGGRGIGKRDLANALAHTLLCQSPDTITGKACGQCRSCKLLAAGSHPDLQRVEPEEEGKGIGIDAIRQLIGGQSLTGQYGSRRVVIINPADRINTNGANALLKTLEEPTDGTLLLLLTERPMSLLATIRSRCQQLPMRGVERDEAIDWLNQFPLKHAPEDLLAMASGGPLLARELDNSGELEQRAALFASLLAIAEGREDPVAVAERWGDKGMVSSLVWLYHWLSDLIRVKLSGDSDATLGRNETAQLLNVTERVDIKPLFHILETVQKDIRLLNGQLNRQAMMEDIMLMWQRLFATPVASQRNR